MKEKTFTFTEVTDILKAFHLDSFDGCYSKKLLDWCNEWIRNNVDNTQPTVSPCKTCINLRNVASNSPCFICNTKYDMYQTH